MSTDKWIDPLEDLLSAASVDEVEKAIADHPVLLEDEAIEVYGGIAEEVGPELKHAINSAVHLLIEWRSLGASAALQGLALPLMQDLTESLAQLVINTDDSSALLAIVAQRPNLLGEAAEIRLLEMEADM